MLLTTLAFIKQLISPISVVLKVVVMRVVVSPLREPVLIAISIALKVGDI